MVEGLKGKVLGKVVRPAAGDVMLKRKAYIVSLVPPNQGVNNPKYGTLNSNYWKEVNAHLAQLEAKAGVVRKIFAEGIPGDGENARVSMSNAYPESKTVFEPRLKAGAVFARAEDEELLAEVIDWTRFMETPFASRKVADSASAFYTEATSKRKAAQINLLDQGIGEAEAALLFVGSTDINLPNGVERYVVSPPSLDRLMKWLEQEALRAREQLLSQQQARATRPEQPDTPSSTPGKSEGGLWLPS